MIGISRLYCGSRERSDALRYGEAQAGRPAVPRPVVVWNITRACNLRCAHCYSGSGSAPARRELSTDEGLALLDDLARFRVPVVLFSGGEPLTRPDLVRLITHAARLGLRTVLSTNGTLLDAATARALKKAGVAYVGISLDGLRETNDAFRGAAGAFDRALAAVGHCRQAELKVGLRFSITRRNVGEIGDLFDLARRQRIPRLCFYHLAWCGRGSRLRQEDLGRAATRRAVDDIINRTRDLHAAGHPAEVLTVDNHADGPYLYLRMRREKHPQADEALTLLRRSGGNASGERIAAVGWDGSVYPDQFWRTAELGRVGERTFAEIWSDPTQPLLAALRNRRKHLTGRCARCRFLDLCGGNLRARAEADTGDPWAPDPACYLTDAEIGLKRRGRKE